MRRLLLVLWFFLFCVLAASSPAGASVPVGKGNSSLLGGDLTDPEDTVVDREDFFAAKSEDELKPPKATWGRMLSAPNSPPDGAPHQLHAYQSWQNSPACAIFLNKPETRRWYISFIDGGRGGPTESEPFYCALELKKPHVLTHFTITQAQDLPDRDPRQWAIQGSNTGDEDDWTDIYHCDASDRSTSPFQSNSRLLTTLFTSFTTETMAKAVGPADLKKLEARLKDHKIEKADFVNSGKAYTWFRVVIYSCFNPNSTTFVDFNRPPGFSLGQLELFGVPGTAAPRTAKVRLPRVRLTPEQMIRPEAYDPAFIIMPWCGVPKEEQTLERYKELAECGFNVSFPPNTGEPADANTEALNKKYLDLCQQAGLKALLWDGNLAPPGVIDPIKTQDIPAVEKALDGVISKYSSHPALLGYFIADEWCNPSWPRVAAINQYFRKRDPKHLAYLNLLPAGGPSVATEYEKYVGPYIDTTKPALVSWDHYRQMFEGGDESAYWFNLEYMRSRCIKAGIPYNQIIVSLKHMGYRECSEADLRWQVYTSLAYGSRGIQYFTYWFCKGLAWADAPSFISKEGKRDVKWYYGKKINNHIAKLGPTLVKLTSTGAYCTSPIPFGAKQLAPNAPVKKVDGGSFAIGCFQDAEGKEYAMIVNRSFKSKVAAKVKFNDRISSSSEISQDTGKPLEPMSTKEPLVVPLEPGEGRLFVLSETGLYYRAPEEVYGGKELELSTIEFEPSKPGAKSSGKLFWRAKGDTQFVGLPLAQTDSTHYQVTLPASATKGPLEYYLEMQEAGEKPVREPELGAEAPIQAAPDLAPPSAVLELAAPLVKSYRVVLEWKPATDDRGIARYRVYRGVEDKFSLGEKTLLATQAASELRFTDDAPPSKLVAWYAVQAVDVVGREGEVRYLRVEVPDHQPPANVLTLKATPGSKSVMLAWSGELEPIVASLEIHRGTGPDGALRKVGEVTDVKLNHYIDKDAKYGTQYRYAVRPRSKVGLLAETGKTATASPLRYLKRINCGGPEIPSEDGVAWEADKGRGHANLKSRSTNIWNVKTPVPATSEFKEVYQTERWANRNIAYTFDVEPGHYEVVLFFAETNPAFSAKGKRLFDIVINGQKVAEKINIVSQAGGPMIPWEFRKVVETTEQQLTVELNGVAVGPTVKGIEIRGLPPK